MEDRLRTIAVRFREFFPARRRLVLAGCFLAGVFLLLLLVSNRDVTPVRPPAVPFASALGSQSSETSPLEDIRSMAGGAKEANTVTPPRLPSDAFKAGLGDSANSFPEPRIAYSAELSVVTKEFAHSRSRGPLLALWVALLYFPARFFWRRRSQWAFREAESPRNP